MAEIYISEMNLGGNTAGRKGIIIEADDAFLTVVLFVFVLPPFKSPCVGRHYKERKKTRRKSEGAVIVGL